MVYLGAPSPSEGKSRAEVEIVNRKVARRARAGQTFPLGPRYGFGGSVAFMLSVLTLYVLPGVLFKDCNNW